MGSRLLQGVQQRRLSSRRDVPESDISCGLSQAQETNMKKITQPCGGGRRASKFRRELHIESL